MVRRGWGVAFGLTLSLAAMSAAAADVPIGGRVLSLRARANDPARRAIRFSSSPSAAIAAPFRDPTQGASLLVFSSNASGQCRAEIPLPAANWQPIAGDGANRGWRYTDASGSAGGIRRIAIRPGRNGGHIVLRGRGAFPCGLEADQQQTPIEVALRIAGQRYCAEFGGSVDANRTARFRARRAAAPADCPDDDLTVADLNILHGLFCPAETANCRLEDRVALLAQWIVARGCPDLIALQEVSDLAQGSLFPFLDQLTDVCPVSYNVIYQRTFPFDDSLMLSRLPALEFGTTVLYGNLRNVLHARLDHPIGPIDVFSTHLASGSDLGSSPCGTPAPCPQECIDGGAVSVRDCQTIQLAAIVAQQHDLDTPALVMGDFNAQPTSFSHAYLTGLGWIDSTAAVGIPECDPGTGIGCTSGREDEDLSDLESPGINESIRIDYVFLVPPGPSSTCAATLDTPTDGDGDGVATRLFADLPNPFSPSCGPAPDPMCWVSDHIGVQADVNCE